MLRRNQNTPLTIEMPGVKQNNQWDYLYTKSGLVQVKGFESGPYPTTVGWTNSYCSGWGCGYRASLGGVYNLYQYPEIWEDKDFVNLFREFYLSGTIVLCVTDNQMNCSSFKRVMAKWKELFIVHECGSFPNYTHGPNNMNFIVINLSVESKKAFPVAWDKLNKKGKQNETQAPVPQQPAGSVIRVQRDARGRFVAAGI